MEKEAGNRRTVEVTAVGSVALHHPCLHHHHPHICKNPAIDPDTGFVKVTNKLIIDMGEKTRTADVHTQFLVTQFLRNSYVHARMRRMNRVYHILEKRFDIITNPENEFNSITRFKQIKLLLNFVPICRNLIM